jgi:hypothetical protein
MTLSCLCAGPTPRPSPRGWVIPTTSLSIVRAGPSGCFGGGSGFGGRGGAPGGGPPAG